jgi:hypothetical protein
MFPTVKIIPGKGSSGQQAPGEDFFSGKLFYVPNAALPAGFSTTNRIIRMTSVPDAEAAGILSTYPDETRAILHLPISAVGSTGDIIQVVYDHPFLGPLILCTYVQAAGDTTATILGASIAAAITANQANTGFTAVSATGTIAVTVAKGLGITPNTGTPLTTVITGTITVGSITVATSGVASLLAVWHYEISEFFRMNPTGICYVGFFLIPTTAAGYNFAEIQTVQTFASGIIRNFMVYPHVPNGSAGTTITNASTLQAWIQSSLGLLQTQYTAIFNAKTPGQILFSTDFTLLGGIANLSLDLSTLTSNRLSVIISQDGNGLGSQLFAMTGFSIPSIGNALGVMSAGLVSDNIGDLSQFNLTDGSELAVPAFVDGTLVKNVSANLITLLDLYRYIFVTAYQGYPGVYYNNDHVAAPYTDMFYRIARGRTWDKAARELYAGYLPYLKAKLPLTGAGQLTVQTQANLVSAGNQVLAPMVRDEELSAFSVAVPAAQNPNVTGKLAITVNLVSIAEASEIDITSTFVASL